MNQSEADNNAAPSGSKSVASSKSAPIKTTNRRRLKQQALDILEDYFRRVTQSPSLTEKEALLEKIKAVPGCWDYDLVRMSTWFTGRRQRLRMKERKERGLLRPNNTDSRFPSLTPAAIQHLTVLASNQLHPSPELLQTWTTLLASTGAQEQDVINWIHHRNQEQQLHHLSTPSDTTMTPEYSPTSQSLSPTLNKFPVYKQEAATSPVLPALQLHPYEHEARTTPSEPSPTSNNDLMLRLNQSIIHGVRDALASPPTTSNVAPKTAAEFEVMFSPFEQRISLLLRTLQTT